MLRIGRMAGSISRPTPGRPGSASGRPWALPIRSRLISPMRLSSALLYHAAAAARRAAVPTPFVPAGHFPLTGGIGPAVRNTTTRAFGPPWFLFLTPVHPRFVLSRCGSLAAGSLSLRLGLVSGPPCGPMRLSSALKWYHAPIGRAAGSITPTTPPKPTRAWGAPWAFGIRSVVISPVRLWVALKWSHAPIGRAAGSTTPPTPCKPGPAYGRPWALPIRSGVCLPYAPMGRASLSRCGGCATRGFPPPRARNSCLRRLGFASSLRSIRAAPHASALRFDA